MPEEMRLLQCPACGATVDPAPGQSLVKCPYCGSTVAIAATAQPAATTPAHHNPIIDQIFALVRSDERMRAINMVREYTGNTNLHDAADIVDAIARGEHVDL